MFAFDRTGAVRLAGATALSLIALLASGCGDSASLTKPQFLSKANSICLEQERKRFEVMAEVIESFPPEKAERVTTLERGLLEGLPTYEKATEMIGGLNAPEQDEGRVERALGAMEDAALRVREAPATALYSKYPFREANELLESYGLTKCRV